MDLLTVWCIHYLIQLITIGSKTNSFKKKVVTLLSIISLRSRNLKIYLQALYLY